MNKQKKDLILLALMEILKRENLIFHELITSKGCKECIKLNEDYPSYEKIIYLCPEHKTKKELFISNMYGEPRKSDAMFDLIMKELGGYDNMMKMYKKGDELC